MTARTQDNIRSEPGGPPAAIILAAGKGTRMNSDLPKVVHPVGGRPMVCAVVDACREAGCSRIIVVVGYRQELVREVLREYPEVEYAVQDEQLGTGHAVMVAANLFPNPGSEDVFVLCGDGPLIRAQTLRTLIERHRTMRAEATLATAEIDDPTGYGRILRDDGGRFLGIVEHKAATAEQRRIREVNPSYYCFRAGPMFAALAEVERHPASGEYYLTDVLTTLARKGRRVEVVPSVPPEDVLSINTPEELAKVDAIHRSRRAGAVGGGSGVAVAAEARASAAAGRKAGSARGTGA